MIPVGNPGKFSTSVVFISAPPAVFRSLQAVIRQLDIRRAQVLIEALRRCNGDPSRARLHATLKVLQWYVAGMTVNFSRQELSGSRFVELVQLTETGRYLH